MHFFSSFTRLGVCIHKGIGQVGLGRCDFTDKEVQFSRKVMADRRDSYLVDRVVVVSVVFLVGKSNAQTFQYYIRKIEILKLY